MRVKLLVALLVLTMAGSLAVAVPAAAAGPSRMSASTGTYDCTSTSSQCTTNRYSASAGARGTMVCWEEGREAAGGRKWFYFRYDNGREGFVPANRVSSQTVVDRCSNTTTSNSLRSYRRGVAAARWALSRNGQRAVSRADQDRLAARGGVSPNHTLGDWSGDCSGFVFLAWDSIGIRINFRNARQMWDAYPSSRRRTDRNPPRGALVFWNATSGGTNYGHVEISLGNGASIGTTGWDGQWLPNARASISSSNYLGWVMP